MLRERRCCTKAHAAKVEPTPAPRFCNVPIHEDYKKNAELRLPLVKRVRWPMLVYLSALHALGVYWADSVALGADTNCSATYAFEFFMYAVGVLGITALAHQLWSHRSYKAAWLYACCFCY